MRAGPVCPAFPGLRSGEDMDRLLSEVGGGEDIGAGVAQTFFVEVGQKGPKILTSDLNYHFPLFEVVL